MFSAFCISKIPVFLVLITLVYGEVPESDFFSFGETAGDFKMHPNDDEYSSAQNLSVVFKFFHSNFSTLYVNTNGLVSFLSGVSTYTSEPFPGIGNLIVIAPFWADVDIRYCNSSCNIWYRESDDLSIINKATSEIQQYFPDMKHFIASWTYIATWYNVPFYGASAVGLTKRNTFQCVLITNGLYAFVILNYNKIEWTTGTASDGNSDTGLGGTPAQVGFNMGDLFHYYSVEGSRTSDILNLTNLSNVKYPGKFVFRVDLEEIEPPDYCMDVICQNGGTCLNKDGSYSCSCPLSHTGDHCENERDWCIASNCQNNGTCIDGYFNYTCACPQSHTGNLCETDIDWCIDSNCQNGGTCVDGHFDYTCLCTVSHNGSYCESDIDWCIDSKCQNDGTCIDGLFNHTCLCPVSHTGVYCESERDWCIASNCQNNGTCLDGYFIYTCACPQSHTGNLCETDIDWCIDSNCQNGGTCVDGHFDYTCLCTVSHNGSYCESDINWCIDSKCQNDGTCIDGLFNHTCLCPVSHTGVYCESDIDFCEVHDISCGNGGTCVDGLFDYSCACPLTHTGYHCETVSADDSTGYLVSISFISGGLVLSGAVVVFLIKTAFTYVKSLGTINPIIL